MKKTALVLSLVGAAAPALAESKREMEAHVHGVSRVEIAVEGGILAMALFAPGADIVGFEYAAEREADKEAVASAIGLLRDPANIITLPDAAECVLVKAEASLKAGHDEDHAEGEHGHDDHGHDHEHDDHGHDDHGHDEHAEHDHDHDHDDHGHEDHDEHASESGAEHSEFQASYIFDCAHPENLTRLDFPLFATFDNAQKIDVQFVTATSASLAQLTRDAAVVTLD